MAGLKTEIKARIEQSHRDRFCTKAKALGLKESELLRAVVLAVIGDVQEELVKPDVESAKTNRITIRMPRFLLESAKERAKGKGMVISRWLTALVQANLTGKPVMTDQELAVLQASNRELAAIGRNINQIAKALNEAFHETERVRLDTLVALSQSISENRAAIRSLVRASQQAWEAENGVD